MIENDSHARICLCVYHSTFKHGQPYEQFELIIHV